MIIGTKPNGQKILLRCVCSHSWDDDDAKYWDHNAIEFYDNICPKCDFVGWRVKGMTDEELRRRGVD